MDTAKFELLLKKVTIAVSTIQKLRESEIKSRQQIDKLTSDSIRLQEENLQLKKEIHSLKLDLQGKNNLHKELEDKILEILSYLPDENEGFADNKTLYNDIKNPYEEIHTESQIIKEISQSDRDIEKENEIISDKPKIESEEEMLKQFIKEEGKDDELFHEKQQKSADVSGISTSSNAGTVDFLQNEEQSIFIGVANNSKESINGQNGTEEKNIFEMETDDASYPDEYNHLIEDENKEVSFDFFDEKNTQEEELPRGVL